MPLSAAPTFTPGSAGNVFSSTVLGNGATATPGPFYIGVSGQSGSAGSTTTGSSLGGRVQVSNTSGSATATTNGLQVTVYSTSNGTTYDTVAYGGTGFVVPTSTIANTATLQSFDLPPGQYEINLKNLDTTNAITVAVTLGTMA